MKSERPERWCRLCRSRAVWYPLLLLTLVLPHAASAQAAPAPASHELFAGSEGERYLRVLQVIGVVPDHPWSVREFGPAEVTRLARPETLDIWRGRYITGPERAGAAVGLLPIEARSTFNSGFPFGSNDGAVWAGKGLTVSAAAGIAGRWGALSYRLRPEMFVAENAPFTMLANGWTGPGVFGDGQVPGAIDAPQRFGDDRYARLDPGQSNVRADLFGAAFGVSTANQMWGPAVEYPLLLGTNAPGIPHVFLGTSRPLSVGIGTLHGRLIWGSLAQSDFSTASADSSRRFAAGAIAVFSPGFLGGLELGAARFFHSVWIDGSPTADQLLLPFQGLFKGGLPPTGEDPTDPRSDATNQLASVFARWVFSDAGFEVFGEYAREDHSWDQRDVVLEPDHAAAYTLGGQKVWRHRADELWVARFELLNAQPSHLARVRLQVPFYTHFAARQGHTNRGQILGSPAAFGGAGGTVAVERYHRDGRWTVSWTRTLRQETIASINDAGQTPAELDVIHALGVDGVWFAGGLEITGGVAGAYEFARNFADDAFNLNVQLGVRRRFP